MFKIFPNHSIIAHLNTDNIFPQAKIANDGNNNEDCNVESIVTYLLIEMLFTLQQRH